MDSLFLNIKKSDMQGTIKVALDTEGSTNYKPMSQYGD